MEIKKSHKKIKKIFKKSKRIFIMAHNNLDLDALGSSIGFYTILTKQRKKCFLVMEEAEHELGVGKVFKELEGCLKIVNSENIETFMHKNNKKNLLLILDTNKKELVQAPKVLDLFSKKMVIDHHEPSKKTIDTKYLFIDSEASSTCEIVEQFIEAYSAKINPYIATIILSGIVLDTNNFTLKTDASTFYSAYYLTSLGASVKKVEYLLKQDLEEYIERQKLLTNIEIKDNIAIAKGTPHAVYRREDLAKIADTLLFFNEVEAAFVVAKIDKDEVGVSARSTGDIDIAKIMEKMNGGGDKYNGATKIGTEPISKVVEKLKSILDKE